MHADQYRLTQSLEDLYPETEVALMRMGKNQDAGFVRQPSGVIELRRSALHTPNEFMKRGPSRGSIDDIKQITQTPDGGVYSVSLRRGMMQDGQMTDQLMEDIAGLGKRLPEGAVVQFQAPMNGGNYYEHDVALDAGLGPVQRDTYEQYGVVRNRQLVPVSPFGTLPHYEGVAARQAIESGDVESAAALQSDLRRKLDQGVITLDDLSAIPMTHDRMVDDFMMDLPDSDPDKQDYLQEQKLRSSMLYDEREAVQPLVQALTPESMGRSTIPFANDAEVQELGEKLSPIQRGESPFSDYFDETGRPRNRNQSSPFPNLADQQFELRRNQPLDDPTELGGLLPPSQWPESARQYLNDQQVLGNDGAMMQELNQRVDQSQMAELQQEMRGVQQRDQMDQYVRDNLGENPRGMEYPTDYLEKRREQIRRAGRRGRRR